MTELEINKKENNFKKFIEQGWNGEIRIRTMLLLLIVQFISRLILMIIGVGLNEIIFGYRAPTYVLLLIYIIVIPILFWVHFAYWKSITKVLKERKILTSFSIYSYFIASGYCVILISFLNLLNEIRVILINF